MDDIFDNFPGVSGKSAFNYGDKDDEKMNDDPFAYFDDKEYEIQRKDSQLFINDEFDTIAREGLKSIENSFEHLKYNQGVTFNMNMGISATNSYPEPVERQTRGGHHMMIEMPKYMEIPCEKYVNSPSNQYHQLAQSLHDCTNTTSNFKVNHHPKQQQARFMTEQEIY